MKIHINSRKGIYLFCRIGWGISYNGTDSRINGGGKYNKIYGNGAERYNFDSFNNVLYGFVRTPGKSINLQRIAPSQVVSNNTDSVKEICVIFVATTPKSRTKKAKSEQVIVGWYKDACVNRNYADRPKKRAKSIYNITCATTNAVLLPEKERKHPIPAGLDAIGQSNIFYPYKLNKRFRNNSWIKSALDYIKTYSGGNLLTAHTNDETKEDIQKNTGSRGQPYRISPEKRLAVEKYAVNHAIQYFSAKEYKVIDVSKEESYDLKCTKGTETLFVEVKGTVSNGKSICITCNELDRAKKGLTTLYLVCSIQLKGNIASGGKVKVFDKWDVSKGDLRGTQYEYTFP